MRITLTTGTGPSASTVVLGDDFAAPPARISDWRPSREIIEQIVARPRADAQTLFDRKNRLFAFSFQVSRSLSSYMAALQFIRDHLLAVANQGQVEVSHLDGVGGSGLTFADALVSKMEVAEHVGAWCVFKFLIKSGKMSALNPNTNP